MDGPPLGVLVAARHSGSFLVNKLDTSSIDQFFDIHSNQTPTLWAGWGITQTPTLFIIVKEIAIGGISEILILFSQRSDSAAICPLPSCTERMCCFV